MAEWCVILPLRSLTIFLWQRNESKAMWQDGKSLTSKSVDHLPQRYERGYHFRGKSLTVYVGEGLKINSPEF